MKKIFIYTCFILGVIFTIISCEKDEDKAILSDNPTPPVITNPASGVTLVLTEENKSGVIMFNWKKADFGFKSASKYSVQIDPPNSVLNRKVTVNFSSTSNNSDTAIIKYSDLNAKLVGLKLPKNIENTLEVRIRAILEKTDTVYSDPIIMKVTLY